MQSSPDSPLGTLSLSGFRIDASVEEIGSPIESLNALRFIGLMHAAGLVSVSP